MADALRYALFPTNFGACAIVWSANGVLAVEGPLPSARVQTIATAQAKALRVAVLESFDHAELAMPSKAIAAAIAALQAYAAGKPTVMSRIALDMQAIPSFHQQVYRAVQNVPWGSTLSYGEIAAALDAPAAARAVGQAMSRNRFGLLVPCHRITGAGGRLGGWSADGEGLGKKQLLAHEGIEIGAKKKRSALKDLSANSPATALAHLCAVEPKFQAIVERIGPCNLQIRPLTNLFAALAQSITHQQLTGKAAETIHNRFCTLFPNNKPEAHALLNLDLTLLRQVGLSQAKSLALRDLAEKCESGELPTVKALQRMDNEDIIRSLTAVRGIGRWTVEMLLIFRLGRPDVLAIDDYGIRKGYTLAFRKREMPTPKRLLELTKKWAPHRTIASWYLWRVADLGTF